MENQHKKIKGYRDLTAEEIGYMNDIKRIEAELMIFISQTNMNLSQALDLKLTNFRWMIKDDEYHAFTVYKNRKQGEATFRCHKAYRDIFLRYLQWVKDVGFCDDSSLFPFMAREKLIAKETKRKLHVVRNFCKDIDFKGEE